MTETISRAASVVLAMALAVFAASAAMPPGAAAQGWFDLSRRAPEPQSVPAQSAEIADLSLRIDRLEELVRRLTGEIEMLRHRLGDPGDGPGPSAAPALAPYPGGAGSPSASYSAPPPLAAPAPQAVPPPASPAAPEMSYEDAVRAFNDQTAAEYANAPPPGGPTSLLPPSSSAGTGVPPVLGAPERPLGTISASALRGGQTAPPPAPAGEADQNVASLDAAVIEEAYSRAYSLMIAQDYAGAEAAFETFIARYPGHELVGNAQYWLAETFYARGQYRRAAQEFLAGYQTYGSSTKAPDSLLKLGMTLAALGQNEQACASFDEVAGRFPNADPAVIERARTERGRVGC